MFYLGACAVSFVHHFMVLWCYFLRYQVFSVAASSKKPRKGYCELHSHLILCCSHIGKRICLKMGSNYTSIFPLIGLPLLTPTPPHTHTVILLLRTLCPHCPAGVDADVAVPALAAAGHRPAALPSRTHRQAHRGPHTRR